MQRRTFLQAGLAAACSSPLWAALGQQHWDEAVSVLEQAHRSGLIKAAVIHVEHAGKTHSTAVGSGVTADSMFLLGSISKPICMTALMTLFDQGAFQLTDPLRKYLPQFTGQGRDEVTIQHLLSHSSGLPDQLPNNDALRKKHAPLSEFVEQAQRVPRAFAAGSQYQYSSMGILLAARVAEILTGTNILTLVDRTVFKPLKMNRSAQGLGRFKLDDFIPSQTEFAAVEAGGGDPDAKNWDWNSPYWRQLGAPWGGTHCSAGDIARWLHELLRETGTVVKPETARLMKQNHNAPKQTPRGLGLNVGLGAGSKGCSEQTFGHTGSTGTIAWADPATDTICVVLTSLPARAVKSHPRDLAAEKIAAGVNSK